MRFSYINFTYLGISGSALEWFRSYLKDRQQYVHINGASSSKRDLKYGVPQGSVLGPFLFSVYILPLRKILDELGVPYELYADDNQLYVILKPKEPGPASDLMSTTVHRIRFWLTENFQKVNDSKTELIILSSMFQPPVNFPEFKVGDEVIKPSEVVRDLGVLFDSHMRMDKHVQSIVRGSYVYLKDMYRIRYCLDQESLENMIHAFVTSRLDYCNSILYGLPKRQLGKLQAIQNTAARLITHTDKYDSITPVLKQLHWLKVPERIEFKTLLLTYKSLNGLAPSYLQDLLTRKPTTGLRSDSQNLLVVPKSRTVTYGDRAFSRAAPKLWNAIPLEIKQSASVDMFKSKTKTHLFKRSYQ